MQYIHGIFRLGLNEWSGIRLGLRPLTSSAPYPRQVQLSHRQ
jgi:hypothetical protein